MKENKQMKNEKRGILFGISTSMFLLTILILSILVYQYNEEKERTMESFSLSTRVVFHKVMLSNVLKEIIYETKNLTIDRNFTTNFSVNESITIGTVLHFNQSGDVGNISNLTDEVEAKINSSFPAIRFTKSLLNEPILLKTGNNVYFTKTPRNTEEKFEIYYNRSLENHLRVDDIHIHLHTNATTNLSWNGTTPAIGDVGFTVSLYNTEGANPEVPVYTVQSFLNHSTADHEAIIQTTGAQERARINFTTQKIEIYPVTQDIFMNVTIQYPMQNETKGTILIEEKVFSLIFDDYSTEIDFFPEFS